MSYGTGKNARQGKIARLPDVIRSDLNQRLLDGESGRKILHWLNAHAEVKKLLPPDAEGLHVSDQNLSNWRKGGFEEWRSRRERLARTKDLAQFSVQLAGASGGNLTEGAAAILSGRIMEMLETLDKLTTPSPLPGEEDQGEGATDHSPLTTDPALLKATTESLSSLAQSLTALRVGDQKNRRLNQNDTKLALATEKSERDSKSLELEQQKFYRLALQKFLDWQKNEAATAIAAGGLSNSEKIAKLGPLMFGDLWKEEEPA